MNKHQRIILITAGALVALLQLIGIAMYGLDDSDGWAISLLISAALLFAGFRSWDNVDATLENGKTEKAVNTTDLIRGDMSEMKDKVIVDIFHGAVFKNAQDFYQYIKSKGYYHPKGPLAELLMPDVYSWFVGYVALYVLCLTSEKYRAKAPQLLVTRTLVLREASALSAERLKNLESTLSAHLGNKPSNKSVSDDQASKLERKIFEDHIQSLEAASREAIKNMTTNPVQYPYSPIYRIIGPIFGGIKGMDDKQLAERFNSVFAELLQKTGNVLKAL